MQRTPTQANKLKLTGKNGVNLRANKNDSISTPLPSHVDSPPALGNSPSPIPFFCTQDESDVVWNYYSPTSEKGSPTHTTERTPVTRKRKKTFYYNDFSPVTRIPMKKKFVRPAIKNTEFLKGLKEELTALNQNLQGLMTKNKQQNNNHCSSKETVTSENISPEVDDNLFENSAEEKDNIFNSLTQCILPKDNPVIEASTPRTSKSPLDEEFEDSMNEILIQATQSIEENVVNTNKSIQGIKSCLTDNFNTQLNVGSPKINNDSLDHLLCDMNDSEIEMLASQAPQKSTSTLSSMGYNKTVRKNNNTCTVTSFNSHQRNTRSNTRLSNSKFESSAWNDEADSLLNNIPNISSLVNGSVLNESKSKFMRHNSMPESPGRPPLVTRSNYAGKTFARHISMPVSGAKRVMNSEEFSQVIRCTPEDIKRKHEAAKEKLMAKKLEPLAKKSPQAFYGFNNSNHRTISGANASVNKGQPLKTVSSNTIQTRSDVNRAMCNNNNVMNLEGSKKLSLQEQIERKRQDALLKLQRNRGLGVRK